MIAQVEQPALWIFVGCICATWLAMLVAWLKQRNDLATIRRALKGTEGQPLDQMLLQHVETQRQLKNDVADLRNRMADAEKWMDKAVGYASIVRYDAFDNVSGNQSFAVALQNSEGDGIILNAVSGRDQTRVYGKSLRGGQCESNLTPEEKQAIVNALTRANT